MATSMILVNRAPVLALWASVVAERLGHNRQAALSLGKALTGLNAQSKGQSLGIYRMHKPVTPEELKRVKCQKVAPGARLAVSLMGRTISAMNTEDGLRALAKDKPVSPESAERYLEAKFGDDLAAVRQAMTELARAFKPEVLAARAYSLYERFRPEVPQGMKGWGAKGKFDLTVLTKLSKT
jgi:hypothetical protein